ncbi:hypothetical protein [uncultured Tateyamaria sp.]|uniref:hypothetical protein n=1 Tax=uncultured Tateyamaria sp. TaxID=455651 RepID=UPI00260A823F|nr:hypothetical protein [uncultured Tateyamaria sp.]
MRFLEDALLSLLEFFGFEVAQVALGDLFLGAVIGLFPAAIVGGLVSDWKWQKESAFWTKLPWDWLASILAMVFTIWLFYLLFLA